MGMIIPAECCWLMGMIIPAECGGLKRCDGLMGLR
jgi:hypothetical protein